MDDLLVDRGADRGRKPPVPLEGGLRLPLPDQGLHLAIDLERRDARLHQVAAHPEGVGQDPARFPHVGDLGGRLQLDHRRPSVAFTRLGVDRVHRAGRGDRRQEAALPVVVDEGPGVARVHGEPPADRGLLVVRPLVELPAAVVAASRRPGRRERDVVVPAAAPADPAPAEPRHGLLVGDARRARPGRGASPRPRAAGRGPPPAPPSAGSRPGRTPSGRPAGRAARGPAR